MAPSNEKSLESLRTEISFKQIIEHAPVGILIFQRDWKIKFANNLFFLFNGVLGENPQNVIGQSIYGNRIFEDADIREELTQLLKGETFELEIVSSKTLSGGRFSLFLKGAPITIENEVTGGILILEDIKTKTSETQLPLIQLKNFHSFLTLLSDYFLVSDIDGNVKNVPKHESDLYDFIFEKEFTNSQQGPPKVSSLLFKKLIENVIASNQAVTTLIPFQKDGRSHTASVTLVPISMNNISIDHVIFLFKEQSKDKDEEILSDEAIAELSKYQQITATIIDGLIGMNRDGKIVLWNESASKLFGLTRSEVYGKFIGKIFSSIDEKYFVELRTKIKEKKHWQLELKIGEDESIAEYFQTKVASIGDEKDETILFLCTNITERIHQRNELKKSEERFRNIVTNSHDFICTLDLRGKITYANPSFLEAFQYDEDEIKALSFLELVDPYFLMHQSFNLSEIAGVKMQSVELPLLTKLGQMIHTLASFSTVDDIEGSVQYYNIILTDITLKKESEKDLMLIRSVFEASLDGIAVISKKRFVLVNDSFIKMFGYKTASEVFGENPLKCVAEKDKDRLSQFMNLAEEGKDTPTRYNFTGKRKDSSTFEIENSVSYYQIENEWFKVWVLRDITEAKKAQNELLASEERYRSISENINECIWTAENIGGQLQAVFYTPAIKKITGYYAEEFLADPELWGRIIHPDDSDFINDKLDKLYGDSARYFESLEYRIIDSLGNIIWIENKISLIRNHKGKIQKVFGVINDISLSKRAEEEMKKSSDDLRELNETKDRFISIVSHDLRTPFSSILGYTDILLTEDDLTPDKQKEYIEYIQESSKSMLSLVNSLLDWTRLQTGRVKFEPERINIKNVITKAVQMISGAALQKNISITNDLTKDFYVYADEELILQVFNNLISNAIKFTKQSGNISISARAEIEKQNVRFGVKDNGVGIKKENLDKLFKVDSKYTTPGTSGERGSGLGLSLVYEIIKKHGGDIWVESELGKGSEFIFTIPVASSYILLVDDIKMDRLLYTKLVKSLMPNYNILVAEDGKRALEIIKQYSPALVITDHKMPVMNGYDMVKQLTVSEVRYRPPVILLSSDLNKTIEMEYKELGVEFIFQKPVSLANFKNAIEQSLHKAIFN